MASNPLKTWTFEAPRDARLNARYVDAYNRALWRRLPWYWRLWYRLRGRGL